MKQVLISFSFVLFLVFAGCKTMKKTSTSHISISQKTDSTNTHRQDSAFFEKIETIHDTEFTTKPDSATIRALIKCSKRGEAYLQQIIQLKNGRRISQSISLKNGVLTATAHIDSAAIYFAYKTTHIREGKTTRVSEVKHKAEKLAVQDTKISKKTVTHWPVWLYFLIIGAAGWLFYKYILPFVSPWLKIFLSRFK